MRLLARGKIPTSEQGTIVVISDGEDNCGVDRHVPQLKDRNLPVFSIDLDSPAVEKLQCLTRGTGGFLIETRSARERRATHDFIFRLSRLRMPTQERTQKSGLKACSTTSGWRGPSWKTRSP